MGGYVAQAFCRRHADRVLGVVLADTKATADPDEARHARLRTAERLEAEAPSSVLLEELLPKARRADHDEPRALVYGRVRGLVQSTPPHAAAWAQRAMAARPDSLAALAEVTAPALVLHGARTSSRPRTTRAPSPGVAGRRAHRDPGLRVT